MAVRLDVGNLSPELSSHKWTVTTEGRENETYSTNSRPNGEYLQNKNSFICIVDTTKIQLAYLGTVQDSQPQSSGGIKSSV